MDNIIKYGAVLKLTRNDTLADIEENFVKMQSCGFNTVVIWPAAFWWEKKTENYPFNTGIKLLKTAEKYGLKVIMELAGQLSVMEYIPDFLMKPEYNALKEDGSREFGQSSFGFLNYFHPEVRELICAHYKKTAEAYKDSPALLGYDVFNETMYRSFDDYTIADFRNWLKEKYGYIEKLNEVWERTYSDFSQINYETWKWMSVMPETDYCIYRKKAIARFMKPWCDAIKSVDSEHMLIADNIHSMVVPGLHYARPQDDYGLNDFADKIGMSYYPKGMSGCKEEPGRWEIFDAYYDASGRTGFYISEMQTHIQAMFNGATCVETDELKLWCTEAYSAGAEALIYWMWRPFDKGLQTLGRGLINYRGIPTERFYAAKELGENLLSNGKISPVSSNIAIVYEPICDDIIRKYTEPYGQNRSFYTDAIYGAYKAFYENNVRCDIIRLNEIANYKAIILTNFITVDAEISKILAEYIKNGGHIIADGRFGVVDRQARLCSVIPGESLNTLIGEIYFDTDDGDCAVTTEGIAFKGFNGRHISDVTDGEIIGTFNDGKAAIVRKQTEKGSITTINTELWRAYFENKATGAVEYAKHLSDNLGLAQVDGKTKLKVRISENEKYYFVFAFNYTESDIEASFSVKINGKNYPVNAKAAKNSCDIVKIEKG